MIQPFLGTDKQSYEKAQISKWLSINRISPVTRDILHMSMLCEDHTMAKIIKSLDIFHTTESLMDNTGTSSPPTVVTRTISTTTTVYLNLHFNITKRLSPWYANCPKISHYMTVVDVP